MLFLLVPIIKIGLPKKQHVFPLKKKRGEPAWEGRTNLGEPWKRGPYRPTIIWQSRHRP